MKKLYFIIMALSLVLTFQNCSKVSMKFPNKAYETSNDLSNDPGNIGSDGSNGSEGGTNGSTDNNSGDSSNGSNGVNGSTGNNGTNESNGSDGSNGTIGSNGTNGNEGSTGGVGGNEESSENSTSPVDTCEQLKTQTLVELVSGATIQNVNHSMKYKSNHIVAIQTTSGSIKVLGSGEDAKVDLIKNTLGSILVCYMDIDNLDAIQGSVTLVGGNIKNVTGKHLGSLTIYNGSIDKIKDSQGSVNITNGNIGSVDNLVGSITITHGSITGAVINHQGSTRITP